MGCSVNKKTWHGPDKWQTAHLVKMSHALFSRTFRDLESGKLWPMLKESWLEMLR